MKFSELKIGQKFKGPGGGARIWTKTNENNWCNAKSEDNYDGWWVDTDEIELVTYKFSDLEIGDKFISDVGIGAGKTIWTKTSLDGECESEEYGGAYCREDENLTLVKEIEMTKKMTAKICTNGNVTVFIDGQMYAASRDHLNFSKLREAADNNDAEAFLENINVVKNTTISGKGIEIKDEQVYFNGKVLHNTLTTRLIALVRAGQDTDAMSKFLENLMQNPSSKAISELYDFLENKNLPITDDGCFLGYKSVGSDFYSKRAGNLTLLQGKERSGKIFNGVGEVIECPRNEVDDERDNECSYGLHVGGLQYSGIGGSYHSNGDKCLIVKVNPKDVIAVPRDYNAQKLRTCKYEVVSEFSGALNKPLYEAGDEYGHDDNYTDDGDYYQPAFVDADELAEGDCITFRYDGKTRHLSISEFKDYGDLIVGKLLYPEEHLGEYRSFHADKMSKIEYI